ncbi:hypothetical protein [Bacillus toyonensis]|uniref:hypothetical protein n=1 Tax=Bacillus toyonensis TaxID=155322 RepID=UPI000BEF27EE|nr:hypothetical protein [Bacillus toyonensis]PEO28682.1 hypothetical protein CN589_14010 [Bacillus toyonensis]PFY01390.1 hypothetical protein COL45_17665 [Bacillus toyonensis]PHB83473.1 hypothetical protein COE93_04155 [Bacillus toyonensis]
MTEVKTTDNNNINNYGTVVGKIELNGKQLLLVEPKPMSRGGLEISIKLDPAGLVKDIGKLF